MTESNRTPPAGLALRSSGENRAAIDIGSNSVRLLLSGENNEKTVAATRLSSGLSTSGMLSAESMRRTAEAVADFARLGREFAGRVYVFGTEAVRKAANRQEFTDLVFELSGERVDVLSGAEEAMCGFLGAVSGIETPKGTRREKIATLDIGGASTELAVGTESVESSVSQPLGTVRILDLCGRDREKADEFILKQLEGYSSLPKADRLYVIGGTAATLASVILGLEVFDRSRVHGFRIKSETISELADRLFAAEVDEIKKFPGMDPRRADVVAGGAEILRLVMEKFGYEEAVVSESDNLEGYLFLRAQRGDKI